MSLSITDFQKIANGSHNAGDITLTSSGKLDKVNNHVGILKGWNNKTISATTTLEVKNAFVKALKDAGVGKEALAQVREELGLPKNGGIKGLDLSTLKPLTRAQTRQILDRFAADINQRAGRTVISNRWAALMAAGDANYTNHMNLAAETNQRTAETLAAEQKKLGLKIMANGNDGFNSIPSDIRKSIASAGLSLDDEKKFAKIFAGMLIHGGSDAKGIAAEALKKLLVSKFGGFITKHVDAEKREDALNLFKTIAFNKPATTDFKQIKSDINAAWDAAHSAKLKLDKTDAGMQTLASMLVTDNGIGKLRNDTVKVSTGKFADDLAKNLIKDKQLLKVIIGKFGEQVKGPGALELDGDPSYKISDLKNGNKQIVFTFKAGIGGDDKTVKGKCHLMLEIDPQSKAIVGSGAKVNLKPVGKFTAKDETPVELHKLKILENIKNIGDAENSSFDDNEVNAMAGQMSKWDDMKPGQMKNFEEWLKNDIDTYLKNCIAGIDQTGNGAPITFDERGLASQFKGDNTRSQVIIGGKLFKPQGDKNEAANNEVCKLLPNKEDRKFITGLMNQSTVATMMFLCMNSKDPKLDDDPNAPTLRSMDPAGEQVANYVLNEDMIYITQPKSQEESRYELKIDDKSKTATVTLTQSYYIKVGGAAHDGAFLADNVPKAGKVQYSYEIKVAGLESGNPHIASVGFGQSIEAENMQ